MIGFVNTPPHGISYESQARVSIRFLRFGISWSTPRFSFAAVFSLDFMASHLREDLCQSSGMTTTMSRKTPPRHQKHEESVNITPFTTKDIISRFPSLVKRFNIDQSSTEAFIRFSSALRNHNIGTIFLDTSFLEVLHLSIVEQVNCTVQLLTHA
ncbi:hypothetical protein J6590_067479 [Homalodisca vitripennis]|nr:hypothetical protein J6590_067479 [Homalodisca vitripennis]